MTQMLLQNERAEVHVTANGRLVCRCRESQQDLSAQSAQGSLVLEHREPLRGIFYYALPSVCEHVSANLEGVLAAVLQRDTGEWPADVIYDDLEMYPHLHFLEESRTATPWRLERWYTLAGPCLVVECEQYFERSRSAVSGKQWERWIVHLRQVCDLEAWASGTTEPTEHLLSPVSPA